MSTPHADPDFSVFWLRSISLPWTLWDPHLQRFYGLGCQNCRISDWFLLCKQVLVHGRLQTSPLPLCPVDTWPTYIRNIIEIQWNQFKLFSRHQSWASNRVSWEKHKILRMIQILQFSKTCDLQQVPLVLTHQIWGLWPKGWFQYIKSGNMLILNRI